MSKEKIKSRYISKESVLYHNELPDDVVNKIKHLIDNANLNDDKFNKVKEIYKEQIDAAVSIIKSGYKIDVFIDDENDISSYVFVGYIYRENLSDDEQESKRQKVEFYDKIERLSYYGFVKDSDDRSNKNVKEMFNTLKELLVKDGTPYNKKQISILPVILINQYISYGSMLKLNSNMFGYYIKNTEEYVNSDYRGKIDINSNPYILFIKHFGHMIGKQINGENIWDSEEFENHIKIEEYNVKNVSIDIFDDEISYDGVSFEILNTIVNREKQLHLFIPVVVENDSNENIKIVTESRNNEDVNEKQYNKETDKNNGNNMSKYKYMLEILRSFYYYEDMDKAKDKKESHINVYIYNYNGWSVIYERTKLDRDFCGTSFDVYYLNGINVGLLEIVFNIRFISPKVIINDLNSIDEGTHIGKEIINVINKYNLEKKQKINSFVDFKIKPFDDLQYNHYLLIDNYYMYDRNNRDEKYLRDINEKLRLDISYRLEISVSDNDKYYLGKKIGLNIDGTLDERAFYVSLLKYFIINNLSNSLTEELIKIKNNKNSIKNSENIFLNFDKKYLDYSMLSTRDLYNSHIDYNRIEECDKKLHIEEIDAQYKKNMAMYKEIVDFESKKRGNDLANKLNTIQIMSILLTIIGWGLVIAQANILNKTLNYVILIILAAISGLLIAIFINNFISKR